MNGIGLDCGNTTVKLVLLSPTGELLWSKIAAHRGSAIPAARRLLGELLQWDSGVCGRPFPHQPGVRATPAVCGQRALRRRDRLLL